MINEKFIEYLAIGYLFLFSLYHITTGVISIFFPKLALKFNKTLYGFQPTDTIQYLLIIRPWGNLALVVGVIGFIVLMNLDVYSPILFVFIILLLIRVGYRVILRNELKKIFKITYAQNLRAILIQIIGIVIFLIFSILKIIGKH
ncbi:MAG: hypothetical protein AABX78_02265 [Nanoarchaeota archaeon]